MKSVIVTGSSGLIGSEVCKFFIGKGFSIHGVDNNQRKKFFGKEGDTTWAKNELVKYGKYYNHYEIDIRNREKINDLFKRLRPSLVIHTAAQPSHDLAAKIPYDDFDINAVGTLNILESSKRYCKDSPFIHMSTNKVYGDTPNKLRFDELDKRWDFHDKKLKDGISEELTIDQSKHSLFGASKVAADILVQEYGKYFNMQTCCLRGGCLTGPNHSGVQLHGFLSYLIKCNIIEKEYTIYGYKGKQVRDNIHSIDVAKFMWLFYNNPRCGEVYNIGGGKNNSCSILEAFDIVEEITCKKMKYILNDKNREGDHICYYSNLKKIKTHYPKWRITKSLNNIFREIVDSWYQKNA